MADFGIDTKKVISSSQEIINTAVRLNELNCNLENIKLDGILNCQSRVRIEKTIKMILENLSTEAAKMDSLGDALQVIANQYRATENAILNMQIEDQTNEMAQAESSSSGSDKRNWWSKFWDWITQREPDKYDKTSDEQEKAADDAMKKKMWKVLQDEKYSQENWDNSSVEERKQILQDYMDELIKIYGLKDVKAKICWDDKATYTDSSITWGYYTHSKHTVTLNEKALMDSVGNWDSYDLLETVSHELRHAYQHEAIDHPTDFMVSKETIDVWKENFKHYINSDTDYDGYRNQAVEVDARDFQISRDDKL